MTFPVQQILFYLRNLIIKALLIAYAFDSYASVLSMTPEHTCPPDATNIEFHPRSSGTMHYRDVTDPTIVMVAEGVHNSCSHALTEVAWQCLQALHRK